MSEHTLRKIRDLEEPEIEVVDSRLTEVDEARAQFERARRRLERAQQAAADVIAALAGGYDDRIRHQDGALWRAADPDAEAERIEAEVEEMLNGDRQGDAVASGIEGGRIIGPEEGGQP